MARRLPRRMARYSSSKISTGTTKQWETRLATLAIVPVKRPWMALKPVSNGEPCASAAIGIRRRKAKKAAARRARWDRRMVSIRGIRWTWNQRGILHLQQPLKVACFGAKLTSLNEAVQ